MKKRKVVKICLAMSVFASITIFSGKIMMKPNNNIKNNNEIAIIDPNSPELKAATDAAFKEQLGENYKEIVVKNVQSSKVASQLIEKYQIQKTGEIKYPSDFGGMYINDNQELVIQIVKNSKSRSSIKATVANISNDVVYEYVEHSNEELENINNQIIEYFTNAKSIYEGFKANYVDVVNNIVVVELKNNTVEEQNWFKENVIDSDLIKFIKNETTTIETTAYNAGGGQEDYCSIGYRAKRNGIEGFVSAAHCITSTTNFLAPYGSAIETAYYPSEGIDGVFMSLYSGNSVSNNIQWPSSNTTSITTVTSDFPIFGTLIAKSGVKTHATSGQITNVNYSQSESGVYWSKLVLTSADAWKGDSGGIVYYPNGTVAGIVHGVQTKNGVKVDNTMSYSRANFINSKLNLTRY